MLSMGLITVHPLMLDWQNLIFAPHFISIHGLIIQSPMEMQNSILSKNVWIDVIFVLFLAPSGSTPSFR